MPIHRLALFAAGLAVVAACGDDDPAHPDAPAPDGPLVDAAPDSRLDHGTDLPIAPAYQGLADAIEAERAATGVRGVAALLAINGEVVFAHGFGASGRADGSPMHASTLVRIGSVTKMMTATALLQEVAAGHVALDAPITTYLTDFAFTQDATWAPSITVKDLLTHQSGIVDYLEVTTPAAEQTDAALHDFLVGDFATAYLMAPAGRMYNYSNPNFYLAGDLVQHATGLPYRAVMHSRVWGPLGMDRTVLLPSEAIADGDYAVGQTTDAAGALVDQAPDAYDNGWARPAGYAFSSVFDLEKFVEFLDHGNTAVLPDAQRLAMQTAQVDTHEFGDLIHYGYALTIQDGFFLDNNQFYRSKVVAHDGAIPGFSAFVAWLPEGKLTFITLATADGATFPNSGAYAIAHYATLPPASTPPDLTVNPAQFGRYAGAFQDDFNVGRVTVAATATEVDITLPDVDAAHIAYDHALQPAGPDNFVLAIQGTQLLLTFLFDENGAVEYLRTRPFVAHRTASPRSAPPAHTVDPVRLQRALRDAGPLPWTYRLLAARR